MQKQKQKDKSANHIPSDIEYAYVAYTRPIEDGTIRAPKQITDAMEHDLQTYLESYAKFMTKDLKKDFDLAEV